MSVGAAGPLDKTPTPGLEDVLIPFRQNYRIQIVATDKADLRDNILPVVTTKMKRLEKLELRRLRFEMSTEGIGPWEARSLLLFGCFSIPSTLFCCATALPLLHMITLIGERDAELLPDLLVALEKCLGLATLSLHLTSNRHDRGGGPTPERIVDFPNLRQLQVVGATSNIYRFLSSVSFPSTTRMELCVADAEDSQVVLPNAKLPRHHSGLYASPSIRDRLTLHSCFQNLSDWQPECVSMEGFVNSKKGLRVDPVLRLRAADRFLQFLGAFRASTLTEFALNFFHVTSDMHRTFWGRFFAALPDLRRLELLSGSIDRRVLNRDALH